MKKTIKSQNIEVSEAIETYIETKMNSFERLIRKYMADDEDIQRNPIEERKERVEVFWEVGTQSSGNKRGLFFCKVQMVVPGKAKHIKAEAMSSDLYTAIDEVKDIVVGQIVEIKDKPISSRRRGFRKIKRSVNFDPASRDGKEGGRVRDESI